MALSSLLIANRGEISIRIARAAAELGIHTVAVYSEDDETSLHTRIADQAHLLGGKGAAAYLDAEQVVAAAKELGCDAIHPGYGFLSENSAFARLCAASGVRFVGPTPEMLDLLGDKGQARDLASRCQVPVLPGTSGPTSLDDARHFLESLRGDDGLMVKAVAGGGGRGIRAVTSIDELGEAFTRCQSEARASFGSGDVYVERRIARARHLEVQILGDGSGRVSHLWERECSVQRRNQKLVEFAPSPGLDPAVRDSVIDAALRMARELEYQSLGTFEFLLDAESGSVYFIEANPRLQVEHTVTEEVTGIDLVQTQLRIAGGEQLRDLGLTQVGIGEPRGFAIQARVNLERMGPEGQVRPSGGTLSAFEPPSGPGLRTDSFGYSGYKTSSRFDSLLAKLIVYSPSTDFADCVRRAYRALCEFRIEGVETNLGFLRSLFAHPDFSANQLYTRFVEEHMAELLPDDSRHRVRFFAAEAEAAESGGAEVALAGARVDSADPLAVLDHGKQSTATTATPAQAEEGPAGTVPVSAPLQGTLISVDVEVGQSVHAGQQLFVMEAMKMEHVIEAPSSGVVRVVSAAVGDAVFEGHRLAFVEPGEVAEARVEAVEEIDLDYIRPDLEEALARHALGQDASRPKAVERRRKTGQRTARENVADLCDEGSFVEYGALVIAAQRRRRSIEDLRENTPADGLVAGIGRVNGDQFEGDEAQCIVMSYDYTVLAGTQGSQNHRKKDRMFEIAEKSRLPVVFLTEGGGGRPGDTDGLGMAGLDCLAFSYFGKLSGKVPLVGINSGRCFAGNAALLGCCDVVIATANSNIGMGGPAMIEGGGLGVFRPEEVGPMDVQVPNGVVDIAVEDEDEAVEAAKKYLSYFQGSTKDWTCADQRILRSAIPENRLRIYDVRHVIETLADTDSVLELRRAFGVGMVTALARIEGRPVGIIANNPTHLAGAIDSDGADKAARFMQLCDAFDLPILFLCDTPGIMVGPEAEKTALVRHAARMFVTAGSLSVPFFTIILRKGYGLGAQAMAGGSFHAPIFTISWPTGEFGGMGLEGAVKLGYRKELAAIEDPEERRTTYEEMVARMYDHGKGVNAASHFEIDGVIDPFVSREWVTTALRSVPPSGEAGRRRPFVDTW